MGHVEDRSLIIVATIVAVDNVFGFSLIVIFTLQLNHILVRGFALNALLDKPWSQVSSHPSPPVLAFVFTVHWVPLLAFYGR